MTSSNQSGKENIWKNEACFKLAPDWLWSFFPSHPSTVPPKLSTHRWQLTPQELRLPVVRQSSWVQGRLLWNVFGEVASTTRFASDCLSFSWCLLQMVTKNAVLFSWNESIFEIPRPRRNKPPTHENPCISLKAKGSHPWTNDESKRWMLVFLASSKTGEHA